MSKYLKLDTYMLKQALNDARRLPGDKRGIELVCAKMY